MFKRALQPASFDHAITPSRIPLYRYVVHKCLVTNFVPAASVKQAMNNTFVQALQKQVDAEEAETRKIVRRCESEAEAISKALLGKGVSLMRRAYVNGMQVCDVRESLLCLLMCHNDCWLVYTIFVIFASSLK
jgi:hypothetical protein